MTEKKATKRQIRITAYMHKTPKRKYYKDDTPEVSIKEASDLVKQGVAEYLQ